jgi:hypothetical protein
MLLLLLLLLLAVLARAGSVFTGAGGWTEEVWLSVLALASASALALALAFCRLAVHLLHLSLYVCTRVFASVSAQGRPSIQHSSPYSSISSQVKWPQAISVREYLHIVCPVWACG